MAKEKGIVVVEVDKTKLDMMSETGNHQGVIAAVPPFNYCEVEDILEDAKSKKQEPFVLLLDGIEDPHNLGSIIRTAETAGVHGIIIPKRRGATVNSTVSKVSAGAVEHMKIARVNNLNQTIEMLKENGLWIIGTDMEADKMYYEQDLTGAICMVIGSEGFGMSRLVKENTDILIKIPMKGKITSLNASVSAGIVVYEAVKQRRDWKMENKYNLTLEQNVFLAKRNLVDNIYANARMEGINITFPQTQTILDGVNVPSLKLDEIQCVLNLRDAWKFVINNIQNPINIEFICEVNSYVARNESLEWGKLRSGRVSISGVDYIPEIPTLDDVNKKIEEIMQIENATRRAIEYMLYGMRMQLFWDGNKRTSTLVANKIMIENGAGIIKVPDSKLQEFNELLTEYYNTNEKEKITKFIYDNCIDGIEI